MNAMSSKSQKILINILLYAVLIAISLFMLLPFVWMLSTSFKLAKDIFGYPPQFIPGNPVWDNYTYVIARGAFKNLYNTAFIATLYTVVSLFFTTLGGYGFAKFKFPGRDGLFAFLLATMVIPGAVMMVPSFIIIRKIGWVDTPWALIVPGAASAFGIFFFRQFISTISDELIDAARIDGATEFGIYWRIIVPIIAPAMTSMGLIFFMGSWNAYQGPRIYLTSPTKFVLTQAIMSMQGSAGFTAWGEYMALSVISLIPLLILFLVFQRRIVEGIMAGAVKG
jgi:ABC-type glycerol-3-phosphate transport system permease component